MHMRRLGRYSVSLAEELAGSSEFSTTVDRGFIDRLAWSAPLHDIGKVGVPDAILLKPGKLDPDERRVMESHTIIGFETLRMVAERYNFAEAHLHTAMDVVRHHHERFDGAGYPDRLAGDHIPLSARIVSVCDVYDALRSRRPYKVALAHDDTVFTMSECSDGQFDRRCWAPSGDAPGTLNTFTMGWPTDEKRVSMAFATTRRGKVAASVLKEIK